MNVMREAPYTPILTQPIYVRLRADESIYPPLSSPSLHDNYGVRALYGDKIGAYLTPLTGGPQREVGRA